MREVVFLFDIDGTLVSTGGAGRRAMVGAFVETHGRDDACEGFGFGGMTDRAIARRGLRAIGRGDDDESIDAVLAVYLTRLEGELSRATCRVHPGVHEAIEVARSSPRAAVGLGTGNVRRGAELKLAAAGLGGRFDFGGFGCDHEARAELLRAGARRGADALGVHVDHCHVVVIGDTPRDVDAARAIGAACLAVATGVPTIDELRASGPTLACTGLDSLEAIAFLRAALA